MPKKNATLENVENGSELTELLNALRNIHSEHGMDVHFDLDVPFIPMRRVSLLQ